MILSLLVAYANGVYSKFMRGQQQKTGKILQFVVPILVSKLTSDSLSNPKLQPSTKQ